MKASFPRYVTVVALLLVLGLAAGCAKARTDAQVVSEIQGKLYSDPAIQSRQIAVESANGVVTLSGSVMSDAERAAAASQAASVEGVKTVVNNLAVAPAAMQTAAPEAVQEPAPSMTPAKPRPSTTWRPKPQPVAATLPVAATTPATGAGTTMAAAPVAQSAPAPPPAPKKVTIPTGTSVAIRLVDAIDSETSQPGQSFRATLDSPLAVEGDVAIPAGYDVEGHIVDVKSAGKFAGRSELVLQLDRIAVGNRSYNIQTSQFRREGSSRGKNTAAKVGTGAAIGAIIGGIAGGGKGAAIGAAAGGGLGGGIQAATKGQQINLPTETVLNFELQAPLTVIPTTQGPNAGRQKLEPNN
jgi:hypothetical protein